MYGVASDMATEATAKANEANKNYNAAVVEDSESDSDGDCLFKRRKKQKTESQPSSPSMPSTVEQDIDQELDFYLKLPVIKCSLPIVYDEFGGYYPLAGERNGEEKNIELYPLDWWQFHQVRLPYLSRLARRTLAIPASSAATERLFSHTGNILTAKRNRLCDDISESILLCHDSGTIVSDLIKEQQEMDNTNKQKLRTDAKSIVDKRKRRNVISA